MAGRAVARIQACAEFHRVGVSGKRFEFHIGITRVNRLEALGGGLLLGLVLLFLRPSEHALEISETRKGDQVSDGPEHRDEVKIQPPLGRGIIPFFEVTVPLVAGELLVTLVCRSLFGRPADQPDTPDDE